MVFSNYNAYANINSFNDSLVDAADASDLTAVDFEVRSGHPINSKGLFGTTALMRAVYRGNVVLVKYLLERGADPDIQDIGGATALHFAARKGSPEIINMLTQYTVFGDIPDLEGYTPSMRAAQNDKPRTLEILLEKITNPNITNDKGESIVEISNNSSNHKIRQLVQTKLKISNQPLKSTNLINSEQPSHLKSENNQASKSNWSFSKMFSNILSSLTPTEPDKQNTMRSPTPQPVQEEVIIEKIENQPNIDMSFENNLRVKSSNKIETKKPKAKRRLKVSEAVRIPQKTEHIQDGKQ